MPNRSLIISLAGVGVSLIVAYVAIFIFYQGDKALAIAGLTTVAGLVIPQLLSLKASTDNAAKIQQVDDKLVDNTVTTDATHRLVNSRMSELIATVQRLAEVQKQLVGAQALARGITIGREQTAHDTGPQIASEEPTP